MFMMYLLVKMLRTHSARKGYFYNGAERAVYSHAE